jgi:exosortase A-associated hydrolase 2
MLSGEFLQGSKGPLFIVVRRPAGPARGCVLCIPPFAEEMNKARRMLTEASVALAERGIASVTVDLYGTGDSAGDFADADWLGWQQDVIAACARAAALDIAVSGVVAVRLGCALAVAVSARMPALERTVLWQPVFDGRRSLAQFLRLRVMAARMADDKESAADLQARLKAGETVEVAGYGLSARLARDLEALVAPQELPKSLGEIHWMEVAMQTDAPLSPATEQLMARSRAAGSRVDYRLFAGEPFWSSTEIVVSREMVRATVDCLSSAPMSASA